jgi:hypothetical protein
MTVCLLSYSAAIFPQILQMTRDLFTRSEVRSVSARKRGIIIGFLPYEAGAHDMVQGRFERRLLVDISVS